MERNSTNFFGVFSLLVIVILAVTTGTDGISCHVCNSINGNNALCETGTDASTLHTNCVDARNRQKANYCLIAIGQFLNETKHPHQVVARICVTDLARWNPVNTIKCWDQLYSLNLIEGKNRVILGCTEACATDGCNGKSVTVLADRYRSNLTNFINEAHVKNPEVKLGYPAIFVEAPKPSTASSTAGQFLLSLSSVVVALFFMF